MFAEIAEFVVKRHKVIILAWIIALMVALPFAPLVGTIVEYEETSMAPGSLESTHANDFIRTTFGSSSEQPTTIIVLTSSNVLDNETKRVAMAIESDLHNASLFGDIHKVTVTSIYGVARTYTINVLVGLNKAYTGANLTAMAIYGLPQDYRALWQETNLSAHAFYDIPVDYAAAWTMLNTTFPGRTVPEIDGMTYQEVRDNLLSTSGNLTPDQKVFLFGWLNAFSSAWNGTETLSWEPEVRGTYAHGAAFDPFVDGLPISVEERFYLRMINATLANRPITFENVSSFSFPFFQEEVGSMLENISGEQRALVEGYVNATYQWWSSLIKEPAQLEFENGVSSVASTYGNGITDPSTRTLFLSLNEHLGYTKYNDPSARRATISSVVASLPSVAQQLDPQPWVVAVAGDLGSNYSTSQLVTLSEVIVANSSLVNYPVRIPSDMVGLFVSPSNSTMLISMTYDKDDGVSNPGRAEVGKVRGIVLAATTGTSVKPYVTGSDPINVDLQSSTWEDLRIIEPVTIVLILVLIGLFFRSVVASSVPPMAIGIALGISYALVYLIGASVMTIHYSVLTLMLTSMMGAGCDYCIFVLSRYREERLNGRNKTDSVRQAVNWAGESIATSGATVIIGFGVLAIGRFGMMQSIGVALAIGITIALLVALTLLPSLLILLGDRMFWPSRIRKPIKVKSRPGYFTNSAHFAIKHAKVIVVAALLISVPATYLVLTMQTSYDFIGSMGESESKAGLNALGEGFGEGRVNPTQIALRMESSVVSNGTFDVGELSSIENVSAMIAGLGNVKQVTGPTRPNGVPIDFSNATVQAQYQTTMLRMVGADNRSVLLSVIFVAEPFAKESIGTIDDLRDLEMAVETDPRVSDMMVGGATASMYDIANMVQTDFGHMEYLVIIGIYVVLLVVLGSVFSPLKSILTILLSISWTLALTLLIFQLYLGQPVLYLVPMILLVVCLGLGMDYDILLITRMREEVVKGKSDYDAIVHAVEKTGGIITACGIIMAAAFGSMMLSNGYLLKQFGFALMFAILLDATVVRIYLVPAIMSLMGKWNWWAPGPIRRMNARRDRKRLQELIEAEESLRQDERKVQ